MLMFWYIKPFIYAYLCLPLSTYLPIYKFKKIIPYSLCLIAFYFVIVLDSQKRYEDSAEFPCSPHPTSPIANILTLLYLVAQSCLTLCNPWIVAHQPPLSMGILQARILEWVAMPSSIFYISMVLMATRSSVLAWRIPGAWWAAVYGVTQSRTWLKRLSSSSPYHLCHPFCWFHFTHCHSSCVRPCQSWCRTIMEGCCEVFRKHFLQSMGVPLLPEDTLTFAVTGRS